MQNERFSTKKKPSNARKLIQCFVFLVRKLIQCLIFNFLTSKLLRGQLGIVRSIIVISLHEGKFYGGVVPKYKG